jgi:hypothetical protein
MLGAPILRGNSLMSRNEMPSTGRATGDFNDEICSESERRQRRAGNLNDKCARCLGVYD